MTSFPLKIVTPDGLIFDGEAEELVVRSTTGDVAVLAKHTNFVTPLGMGRAIIVSGGIRRTAACIGGMLSVVNGSVTLVPTTFEWSDKIDLERADDWFLDPRVPAGGQAGPELYARNDLDRGHLVRRRDPVWGPPAVAARAWTTRIPSTLLLAALLGVAAVVVGLLVSWHAGTAAGASIACCAILAAGLSALLRNALRRLRLGLRHDAPAAAIR